MDKDLHLTQKVYCTSCTHTAVTILLFYTLERVEVKLFSYMPCKHIRGVDV